MLKARTVGTVEGLDVNVTSDLASEPVTLDDVKDKLKIDYDDEDDLITSLIKVARQQLEAWSGLAFGEKEITMTMQSHRLTVDFPIIPVNTVDSVIVYKDSENEETLVSGDDYLLIGTKDKKLNIYDLYNDIEIQYTTPELSDSIADSVKEAIKSQVAFLYEHRGDSQIGGLSPIAKALLQNHRKVNVF